jgi:hypothetical protein
MASASLGPDEFDEPEPLLPLLPELPELPKEPPPNGEPLPKGLAEDPELPEDPEDPEPDGTRVLPDVGLKACVLLPLFDVA